MPRDFPILAECKFEPPDDPCYDDFLNSSSGPFMSNGVVAGVVKRSKPTVPDPDLFIFGLVGDFKGYKAGYTRDIKKHKDRFTWAILKGYSHNRAGTVALKSKDHRDTPAINFHYFEEGTDTAGEDLDAVVNGIKLARSVMKGTGATELLPGPSLSTDEQLRDFVKNEAWGHHASCSNKMGPASDPLAVVDSQFRVHGTTGLRIVDASVFPAIPGLFIATPIYMISEKAAELILAAAAT
jgi:choline dehydrogenase